MAVIRGPSVRLWFENCAENRKHCHERGAWGEIRGGKLASLAYYGSRYYRGARGISSAREVAEEFSFGTSIVAMRGGERERERERERRKIRTEKLDTRDILRAECDNLCFTFNKTERGRRRTIEPVAAVLFYRVYNPSFAIRVILSEFVSQKI